jgi:ribonuclease E
VPPSGSAPPHLTCAAGEYSPYKYSVICIACEAGTYSSSSGASTETSEVTEILDIPVTITKGRRKKADVNSAALESVLDALPEPSDPGKGRPKRRRVSTDSITAEVTEPAV